MNMHVSYGKSDDYDVIPLSHFRFLYFQKNYEKILKDLPRDIKILEVGPGGGTFAEYLMEIGFHDITLCDYSAVAVPKLQKHFEDKENLKIIQANAISLLKEGKVKYDLIVSQHVIEHFTYDDFVILLESIYTSLNKDGLVILETNNCANIFYGSYLRYCDHTHLLGFTPRSLENFLKTKDFKIINVFSVHLTSVKDVLSAVVHGFFNKKDESNASFNKKITSTPFINKIGLGAAFILRSWAIVLSRFWSFIFIYPYDKSLGLDRSVFTPLFGIIARKD